MTMTSVRCGCPHDRITEPGRAPVGGHLSGRLGHRPSGSVWTPGRPGAWRGHCECGRVSLSSQADAGVGVLEPAGQRSGSTWAMVGGFVLRRGLLGIITLLLVSILIFGATQV